MCTYTRGNLPFSSYPPFPVLSSPPLHSVQDKNPNVQDMANNKCSGYGPNKSNKTTMFRIWTPKVTTNNNVQDMARTESKTRQLFRRWTHKVKQINKCSGYGPKKSNNTNVCDMDPKRHTTKIVQDMDPASQQQQ